MPAQPGFIPTKPDPSRILITDVSFYQDDIESPETIDFNLMRDRGVRGTIIRAGQRTWPDRDFKRNWREAKKSGLPRGSYWFYDSWASPKKQAELYVSMFDGDFGEMPMWCDFEENYNGMYAGWKNWYDFMEAIKRIKPDAKLGVYTGYYYWMENAPMFDPASLNYFKQYELWIAAYNPYKPIIPKPFTTHTLWQFTDALDGIYYGSESYQMDGNYFNGTEEDWVKYLGGFVSPPPVTPELPDNKYPTIEQVEINLSNNEKMLLIKK